MEGNTKVGINVNIANFVYLRKNSNRDSDADADYKRILNAQLSLQQNVIFNKLVLCLRLSLIGRSVILPITI